MTQQKLFYTKGHLLTNARGRLRGAPKRTVTPIEPQKNESHVNDCGCLRCRVTHRVDEAVDRELNAQSRSAPTGKGKGLPPSQGVLRSPPKGKSNQPPTKPGRGPLTVPPGVLAGGAQ